MSFFKKLFGLTDQPAAAPQAAPSAPAPEAAPAKPAAAADPAMKTKVTAIIAALGGQDNIKQVEACASTRLRIELTKTDGVDDGSVVEAGANGFQSVGDNRVHVLVGLENDAFALEMNRQLS